MATFIDEVTITAEAGAGGAGVVRWRHEKGKEFSGAAGGNGGRGGNVYVRAIRDIQKLYQYKSEKDFYAGKGDDGGKNSRHGADGKDITIDMPIGSIITNTTTGKKYRLTTEDQTIMLLEGGRGGLGNEHFKASTNTSPKESTPGKPGEKAEFYVELELLADAGFVGLPNAGKSSLLNALTNAKSKVASYAFTTLDPALGNMEGFILADIPGLIEGASAGRGLGHKFLRHVRRTKLILHCISLENEKNDKADEVDEADKADEADDMMAVYTTVRKELEAFDPQLATKEQVIILTKTDMLSDQHDIAAAADLFKILGKKVFTVSVLDDASVKLLKDNLVKILREE